MASSRAQSVQSGEEGQAGAMSQDNGFTTEDFFDRAMARGGITDKTFEEAMLEFSTTPLFMNARDASENEENVGLQALQAMQYEGTRSEIARNFKEQGNECVTVKQWKDAREFYTKGLEVLTKIDGKWDLPNDAEVEEQSCKLLSEQLYANRSRCNLELKNYRATILDCAAALKLNPANIKAHYRSASALFALDRVYEALDVCYRGTKIDPENVALSSLLEKIQRRSRIREAQDRRRREDELRKQRETHMLATALEARSIKTRGTLRPPDMADVAIRLSPDPLSPKSTLEFPVMLLYPMHSQSDFIQAYGEKDPLVDHLGYIFPLPWDEEGQYTAEAVDCFMDTISGGMMKVGKKLSLLEILGGGKTEVVDGMVRIHIVPRRLTSQWIEEVKAKKGK